MICSAGLSAGSVRPVLIGLTGLCPKPNRGHVGQAAGKEADMTAKQVAMTYVKEGKWLRGLLYFCPIKRIFGQWFIMLPHWYNGNFSMKSVNRAKF